MSDIIPNESHNSLKIPALLHRLLGEQFPKEAARIEAGLLCQRRTTLRVNALKTTAEAVRETLSSHNIAYRTVSWYHDALILEGEDGKRAVEALPLYERGEIYFQSLSSMLPPLVLCPKAGESILDMTAAPGGKTTELAALSEGGVLITACEKDKIRFERLKFNLSRQGAGKVNALHADATKLDDFFRFDKILLDAPCSGSVLRKAFILLRQGAGTALKEGDQDLKEGRHARLFDLLAPILRKRSPAFARLEGDGLRALAHRLESKRRSSAS